MFISIYLKTRCYGGPEEGGWYYNHYELCKSWYRYINKAEARKIAYRLQALLSTEYIVDFERVKGERKTEHSFYC